MGRWYEGAEEAAFKAVSGGYVAQLPGPFLVGRSRSYFVNEAQKAEIVAVLRRQRLMMIGLMLGLAVVGAGCGLLLGVAHGHGYAVSSLSIGIGTALFLVLIFAACLLLTVFALRPLQPLLATLPRTEERISFNERAERVARSVSAKIVAVGIICGPIVVISNALVVTHSIHQGRFEITALWNAIAGFGALVLTAYFVWLGILRRRLARRQQG
jgi:MFS family permease